MYVYGIIRLNNKLPKAKNATDSLMIEPISIFTVIDLGLGLSDL